MTYPARHFPGTPESVKRAVRRAVNESSVPGTERADWIVGLEAIARYETDCEHCPPPGVCAECRGMCQCSEEMYREARAAGFIRTVDYCSPKQAVKVAIRYIRSELPGFGGYHGIGNLLASHTRGPGDCLRAWIVKPLSTFGELRSHYHGY